MSADSATQLLDPITIDLWSVAACWSHLRSSSHPTLAIAGTHDKVHVGVTYAFTESGPVIFVAEQDELGGDTAGRQLVLETAGHDDHGHWVVRVTGTTGTAPDRTEGSPPGLRLIDPRVRGYTATSLLTGQGRALVELELVTRYGPSDDDQLLRARPTEKGSA